MEREKDRLVEMKEHVLLADGLREIVEFVISIVSESDDSWMTQERSHFKPAFRRRFNMGALLQGAKRAQSRHSKCATHDAEIPFSPK